MAMARAYRIVCIGGGTGMPVVLRGLREYRNLDGARSERIDLQSVTAVVSFSDDGGSSGRLIREFDTLPPGDLRNCLLALADPALVPLMTQFFNHRFSPGEGDTLAGHSAGNLLIVALAQLHEGDVRKAILDVSRLLGIEGKIVFATLGPAVLCAELTDGTVVVGESAIPSRSNPHPISRVFLAPRGAKNPRPGKPPAVPPMPEALAAIEEADAIVLGPGSLYTSVIPNLLVPGVADAVRTARATKIYVSNLMTEPGETDDFSVARHLESIHRHGDIEVDFVITNSAPIDPVYTRLYTAERLQKEMEILQRLLASGARPGAKPYEPAFRERVARMQMLLDGLSSPESDRGQVVLQHEGESLGHTKVLQIDVVREEELREGGRIKTVLRHHPHRLVEGILAVIDQVEQSRAKGQRVPKARSAAR